MKRLTVTLVAAGLLLGANGADASNPGSSSVTVPKSGPVKTKPVTWSGKVPNGSTILDPGFGLTCNGQPSSQLYDSHSVKVTVPAGAYKIVKATMSIAVQSSPLLNGDFIEVLDPSGASVGMDGQKGEMVVDVFNPVPGVYKVLVCTFIPDAVPDHDYTANVTIKTKCKAASPCPAPPKRRR
ncbi:MAG: hypothetical protein M3P04_10060 [Actinomycetota bacterium]|nr:hypothetical protein [Actinomycetota bacterium]